MHSMPPRIVVVGSSNTDLVLQCPRLPQPGETLLGGEFAQHAGGKGANQAVAAARAGAKVTFIGACGEDDYGRQARAGLRKEGINLRYFRAKAGIASGIALILVGGKSRENVIGVARSANDLLTPGDVREAAAAFKSVGAAVSQLEIPIPTVLETARLANENRVPFILNPAPANRLPPELLRLTTILTPNEHEAHLLSGSTDLHEAGRRLLKRGCQAVVITLGSRGALLCEAGRETLIPCPKVRAVDTVGAGDCFTGCLAVGIAQSHPMAEAVQVAAVAASISVTRPGAQAGMPHAHEVREALASASRKARSA